MKIAKTLNKKIFCLEGDWDKDLRDKSSISAALDFLHVNCRIDYIHKNCGTKEALKYYLSLWKQKRYHKYNIAYLAFHGHPGQIQVGKEYVNLEELAEILEGACKDKIIHFGSCNTLDTDQKSIEDFLTKTGAMCICGFRSDIDFLESSVFDMLLIRKFQEYKDVRIVDRELKKNYNRLIKQLNFRFLYL